MFDFIKGILTVAPKTDSPAGTINKTDVQHILQNGLLVGGASALSYFTTHLAGLDLGAYGPAVLPIITMALVAAQQWCKDNTKE